MENTDKTKILFCNIGWMENYKGQGVNGDFITGGGAYIEEHGTGFEVCNFSKIRGYVCGYVRTRGDDEDKIPKGSPIKLERITARKKEGEYISGVTVVWTAKRPKFGTVIVGWYNNAKVFRRPPNIKSPIKLQRDNHIFYYKILASVGDEKLLPPDKREFRIPRRKKGFMGQSNIWYADKDDSEVKSFVSEVIKSIKKYKS
ncbi:MAG: hypothetical protein ACNYPH_00835 [Gammaproteobacteria bacterium WSBS_2016_MAG_OTU1]